jgi:hypothetical protein
MESDKKWFVSCERVWLAAYTDEKNEYFELRVSNDQRDTGFDVLWHKEFPLGQSFTDYMYVGLEQLERELEKAATVMQQMRQRPDYEDRLLIPEEYDEDYGELTAIAGAILEISPLLLPVAADVVRACVKTEPVGAMGEIDSVMRVYRALQSDFMYLAQEIFSPEKGKKKQRIYMKKSCFGSMDEQLAFGTLAYGELRMEWVRRGWNVSMHTNGVDLLDGVCAENLGTEDIFVSEVLNTEDREALQNFLVSRYLKADLTMCRCKYCGRYFAATDGYGGEYCDRRIDGSQKTCKEMGPLRLYEQRIMEDPAVRAYKRAYKAHNARIRYGLMTKDEFSQWSKEARKRRDACLAGEISVEDLESWLNRDRLR